MSNELWKDVVGYETYYEVSSIGNVRSKRSGRLLKGSTAVGYRTVFFTIKSKTKTYYVHRLVCTAFIPNPENKPQVNHMNMVRTDNHIENLEWCTCKENQIHSFANGRNRKKNEGYRIRRRSLSDLDVSEIRSLTRLGVTREYLSTKYRVSIQCVKDVINRRTFPFIN